MTLPSANQFPAIAYKKGLSERPIQPTRSSSGTACRSSSRRSRRWSDEGVKYIQIDAPRYSYYIDPKWRQLRPGRDGRRPRGGARRRDPGRQRLPRRRAARRRRRSPSTSAAATTAASGTPRAATTRSPRSCSTSSTSTPSCSSTSPSAPAASSRCASCRTGKTVVLGLVVPDGRQLPPAHRLFSSHTYSSRPSLSQSGRSVSSKSCENGRVKIFGSSMVMRYCSLLPSRRRRSVVRRASVCQRLFVGSV